MPLSLEPRRVNLCWGWSARGVRCLSRGHIREAWGGLEAPGTHSDRAGEPAGTLRGEVGVRAQPGRHKETRVSLVSLRQLG